MTTKIDYYYWKDKNKLCICQGTEKDEDRFIFIDIDDLSLHGISGRKVKRTPNGFAFALKTERWWGDKQFERHYSDYPVEMIASAVLNTIDAPYVRGIKIRMLPQLEKLINALAPHGYYVNQLSWSWEISIDNIYNCMEGSKIKFKDILNKLDESVEEKAYFLHPCNDDCYTISLYNLAKLVDNLTVDKRCQKYAKHFDVFGREDTLYIIDSLETKDWWERYNNIVWEWLEHPQTLAVYRLGVASLSSLISAINQAMKYAMALEREPEKGTPFFQWEVLKRDYNAAKDEIADRTLAKTQNLAFAFEDDNFVAIVPTTVLEFTNEGAAMGNCIGGLWLNGNYGNNPYEGTMSRGAVFIRRKSDIDKSFVDCDFMLDTGRIEQCYGKNNMVVVDEDFKQFQRKLQNHLQAVCSN